jgi:hypothetical protein
MFYAGALEEKADRRRTEFLAGWDRMPRDAHGEAFPLLMIGTRCCILENVRFASLFAASVRLIESG